MIREMRENAAAPASRAMLVRSHPVRRPFHPEADHVLEIWQGFKRAHALVLKIAEGNDGFRAFLDGVRPERLPRLDEIVALVVAGESEAAVTRRLNDGSLNQAVHVMPDEGLEIARETKSVDAALTWTEIAGDKLPSVLEYELHRRADPKDFTRVSLARVLALQDRTAIIHLAAVPRAARDTLFSLETADLTALAKGLSDSELTTLASYLTGLQQGPREQVLRTVAATPAKMQVLASTRVRDGILASPDQQAAVTMMLRPASSFSPREFAHDLSLASDGRISPWLIWDKHPGGLVLLGLLALMLALWLKRLVRPRVASIRPAEGA